MPLQIAKLLPRFALSIVLLAASGSLRADGKQSHGQLLYVPVYSEVPFGDKMLRVDLTVTLSVRNTDGKSPIRVTRVDYYSSSGSLVHAYLKQPAVLGTLSSVEHIVKETDRTGGISASFLVEWESEAAVSPPLVEALMVSNSYNRALAFNTQARVLAERP
jgi:hypothetical protein